MHTDLFLVEKALQKGARNCLGGFYESCRGGHRKQLKMESGVSTNTLDDAARTNGTDCGTGILRLHCYRFCKVGEPMIND